MAVWNFVLLAAVLAVTFAIRDCVGRSSAALLARSTLIVFSVIGFVAFLSLISAREWRDPNDLALFGFLVGPRYLLPAVIILLGSFLWCISFTQKARVNVVVAVSLCLGLATYLAHPGYECRLLPRVAPLNLTSHDRA